MKLGTGLRGLAASLVVLLSTLAATQTAPAAAAEDLVIEQARIRLPLPGQTTAVVYLRVTNRSHTECLLERADVDAAERAELHEHRHEGGMMRMRPVETVRLGLDATLEFRPHGYHIMALQMQPETDRDHYRVTLHCADGRSVGAAARVIR